jgi:tetratricopeptide (TPR) repeat protein
MSSARSGDLVGAAAAAERSVELLNSVNDHALIFEAWSVLVTIALLTGRADDAESLAREQVDTARAAHLPQYEEWGLARVGYALAAKDDLGAARDAFDAALALGAERWADAFAYVGRAICARRAGDHAAACDDLRAAMALQERIGALTERAYLHLFEAWLHLDAADAEAARVAASRATDLLPDNLSVRTMASEVSAAAAAVEGAPIPAFDPAPPTGHMVWIFTRRDVERLLT